MRVLVPCRHVYLFIRRKLACAVCILGSVSVCVAFLMSTKQIVTYTALSPAAKLRGWDSAGLNDVNVFLAGVSQPEPSCYSVFPGMLLGRWIPRNVSAARRREMDEYLHSTRGEYRIPRTLQRADGRCGNLPYDGVPLYRFMWFRSLCNPEGPTPCCHDFRCSNRSQRDCSCPTCLDSRTPIHAELSDWVPASAGCKTRQFGAEEACRLLKGTTLVLAGDSFVRHVFVALVMLLTDNFQNGALQQDADRQVFNICQGMYQINGLRCRDILDQDRVLCNGTVTATYLEVFQVTKGRFLLPHVQRLASKGQKLLLLLGVGIHDDFRAELVWTAFLQPLVAFFTNTSLSLVSSPSSAMSAVNLTDTNSTTPAPQPRIDTFLPQASAFFGVQKRMLLAQNGAHSAPQNSTPPSVEQTTLASPLKSTFQSAGKRVIRRPENVKGRQSQPVGNQRWPRMVWLTTHAPGLLKTPVLPAQSLEGVRYYNGLIARLLRPYAIPILDSFNMTAPLHSVDGTHYGYGANALKVQFLLNWVKERQDRSDW